MPLTPPPSAPPAAPTAPGDAPQRANPGTFRVLADAFIAWLVTFRNSMADLRAWLADYITWAGVHVEEMNTLQTNIDAVMGDISSVNAVAGDLANIDSVGGSIANVNSVAGSLPNVNTVAGAVANVNTVAGAVANVNTVAGAAANVATVASNVGSVSTVASNMSTVQQAVTASATAGVYPSSAASNVPRGLTQASVGAITGGTGGTNGTFALGWGGGNFLVNPTGTFTVAGGVLTAVTITGPGLYIGGAPSVPTPSFAASSGLAGAAVALTAQFLVTSGQGYWVQSSDNNSLLRYRNVSGVATADATVQAIPTAAYLASSVGTLQSIETSSTKEASAARARLTPNGSMPGPEAIFGSNLIAYFGPWSRRTNGGVEPTYNNGASIDKVYGAGAYDTFTLASIGGGTTPALYVANGGNEFFGVKNSNNTGQITAAAAAGAGAAWLAGDNPLFAILWNGGASITKGTTVLFSSGDLTVDAYFKNSAPQALGIRMLVGGVVKYEWLSVDTYTNETGGAPGANVQGFAATRVTWHWRNGAPIVKINDRSATVLTATPNTTFTPGDVTIGPITAVYSACLAADGMDGDGARLHAYHQQTTVKASNLFDLDVESYWYKPATLVPARKDRQDFLPVTVAGPFKDISRLTLGSTVAGNLPVPTIPGAPNVTPWDAPHDRTIVDASLYRFCLLTHPDFPNDPTKLMMHGSAIFMPSDGNAFHQPVLYESFDSGANFTRKALNLYSYPPGANTGVTNNMTQPFNASLGRTLDLLPWFPNGLYIPSVNQSFKYIWHKELDAAGNQNATLWGVNDPRVPSSWVQIPIREHCWPHPYDGTAANDQLLSYGPEIVTNTPNTRRKYRVEEKGLHYDPVSNRFFRFTRLWGLSYGKEAGGAPIQNLRQMYIAWSREGDPTRWPKELLRPIVLANDLGYQDYDMGEPLQIRTNLWLIPVHVYADHLTGLDGSNYPNPANPALTNYDRNLKMWTDMYVSFDQLRSPPILARKDFMTCTADTDVGWYSSWALCEFGHSLKQNMYMIGGKRRHGTGAYNPDYEMKLAKIAYAFPTSVTPDRTVATGWLATNSFDGRKVRGVRIEKAANAMVRARVCDAATGRPIPGMDLHDSMMENNQIVRWNWSDRLPTTMIYVEVQAIGAAISGVYPIFD